MQSGNGGSLKDHLLSFKLYSCDNFITYPYKKNQCSSRKKQKVTKYKSSDPNDCESYIYEFETLTCSR